jgi:hypothetical protein
MTGIRDCIPICPTQFPVETERYAAQPRRVHATSQDKKAWSDQDGGAPAPRRPLPVTGLAYIKIAQPLESSLCETKTSNFCPYLLIITLESSFEDCSNDTDITLNKISSLIKQKLIHTATKLIIGMASPRRSGRLPA